MEKMVVLLITLGIIVIVGLALVATALFPLLPPLMAILVLA
jgi:hypothetical protein